MRIGGSARFCIGCGYRLQKTIGEYCPECGRGFSVCDTGSWASTPWHGRILSTITGPPRRTDFFMSLAAMALTLIAYAPPGRYAVLTWVAAGLWLACVVVWMLRLEWGRFHQRRLENIMEPAVYRRSMAFLPVLLLVTVALIGVDVPVRIGFMLSRAGLENARNLVGTGRLGRADTVRAGIYTVRLMDEPTSIGLAFGVEGDGSMLNRHFVHVPDGEINNRGAWVGPGSLRLSTNWFVSGRR